MIGSQMARALTCLCLLLTGNVSVRSTGLEGDWDVVLGRLHESAMTGSSHQNVDYLLNRLQPDGSFSDLSYGEDGSTSITTHGRRQGALAYHYLNGEDVAQQVVSCFTYITYDAPENIDPNWWGHLIGVPTGMWEGAVLARDILSHDLLMDFLDRYWLNTNFGSIWDLDDNSEKNSGGNFGPRAMLAEVEGLLRGTYVAVHAEVDQELYRELVQRQPWNDAGLRPDGCLHQHNLKGDHNTEHAYLNHTLWVIYNGDYGKEMLRYESLLMTWYTGTELDFDDAIVEGLFSAYLECHQWLFRGHTAEPTSTGRFIDSGSMVTQASTKVGVKKVGQCLQKLGRHQKELEAVLHRYDNVVPDPQFVLHGNKFFFNSDLMVHQRREYMASLRILSNRTARQESWPPNQNSAGFFQADGFLTLLVDSKEYGTPDLEVFSVYDWAKVAGVTNLYTTDIPQYHSGSYWAERFFNNVTFAGGVTDGSVGLAAMAYNRPHVAVTCLKSWFFLDDVIVTLGSAITLEAQDPTGERVITTLAQVSYDGRFTVGTEDGEEVSQENQGSILQERPAWLHHRHVGYVFLNGDELLDSSAESRLYGPDKIDVFTALLDHGPTPKDASLAYAILPASDLARTRAFSADPEVEVISNTKDLHVVCHHPSKTIGASLAGSTRSVVVERCGGEGPTEVRVDAPCLFLLAFTSSDRVALTLADPQQEHDLVEVQLTVDGRQAEQAVPLPSPPMRGSSVTTSLLLQ